MRSGMDLARFNFSHGTDPALRIEEEQPRPLGAQNIGYRQGGIEVAARPAAGKGYAQFEGHGARRSEGLTVGGRDVTPTGHSHPGIRVGSARIREAGRRRHGVTGELKSGHSVRRPPQGRARRLLIFSLNLGLGRWGR